MNYVKETLKYIVKNFLPLALIFIAPSVVLAFFVNPMATISFIPVYAQTPVNSYYDFVGFVLNFDYLKLVYPPILIFITLLLSFCIGMSVIERHFRVGKLNLKKPFSNLNDAFIPGIIVLLICAGILVLYSVILLSVTFLLHVIISGISNVPNVANLIITTITSLAVFILFMTLTSPVGFMMPLMITYGYRFTDAISQAYALVGKKLFKVTAGIVFPFIVVAILEYILSFFNIIYAIDIIIAVIFYLFLTIYITAYIVTVMFDLSNLERRDKFDRYKRY